MATDTAMNAAMTMCPGGNDEITDHGLQVFIGPLPRSSVGLSVQRSRQHLFGHVIGRGCGEEYMSFPPNVKVECVNQCTSHVGSCGPWPLIQL